jgi:ankyrin repeat protein
VDGRPLILYASDYGQEPIIRYLLSKGADPNVNTRIGCKFSSLNMNY